MACGQSELTENGREQLCPRQRNSERTSSQNAQKGPPVRRSPQKLFATVAMQATLVGWIQNQVGGCPIKVGVNTDPVDNLPRNVLQPMHRSRGHVSSIQGTQSPTWFRGTTVLQAAIQYRVDVRDDRVTGTNQLDGEWRGKEVGLFASLNWSSY